MAQGGPALEGAELWCSSRGRERGGCEAAKCCHGQPLPLPLSSFSSPPTPTASLPPASVPSFSLYGPLLRLPVPDPAGGCHQAALGLDSPKAGSVNLAGRRDTPVSLSCDCYQDLSRFPFPSTSSCGLHHNRASEALGELFRNADAQINSMRTSGAGTSSVPVRHEYEYPAIFSSAPRSFPRPWHTPPLPQKPRILWKNR